MRLRAAVGTLLLLAAGAYDAAASPALLTRFGGLGGDATYEGAFSIYWNPAALARPGWDVGLSGQLILRQASYDRDAVTNQVRPEWQSANAGLARSDTHALLPGLAGGAGLTVGDLDVGGGAGMLLLHAGAVRFDQNTAAPAAFPGALDGPQRWSTIRSQFYVLEPTLGAAVRHRPTGFSLGATATVAHATLKTTRARNLDQTDDLTDAFGQLKEGRVYFEGSDTTVVWSVGLRWSGAGRNAVGLTFHRGPKLDLQGDADVAFGLQPPSHTAAHLAFPIADVVRAAGALGLGACGCVTLRPSIEYARWSVFKRQVALTPTGAEILRIERDFNDTLAARLRADVRLHPRLVASAGAGYESAATPSRNFEPGFAEAASIEGGLGAAIDVHDNLRVVSSFIVQRLFDTTITDSQQKPTQNGRYVDLREFVTVDLELAFGR